MIQAGHESTGSFISALFCVQALGMSLKNFPFVEVSSARSSSHFVNDPWDGVFGLQSTYAHFIRRGIRKPGLYLRRTCSTGFAGDAGTITVNGLDSKNCGHAGTPLELRYENCVRTVHVTGLFTLYDNSRVFRRFESVANPPSMQVASAQVDSIEIEGGPWRAFVTLNVPEILVPQVQKNLETERDPLPAVFLRLYLTFLFYAGVSRRTRMTGQSTVRPSAC